MFLYTLYYRCGGEGKKRVSAGAPRSTQKFGSRFAEMDRKPAGTARKRAASAGEFLMNSG